MPSPCFRHEESHREQQQSFDTVDTMPLKLRSKYAGFQNIGGLFFLFDFIRQRNQNINAESSSSNSRPFRTMAVNIMFLKGCDRTFRIYNSQCIDINRFLQRFVHTVDYILMISIVGNDTRHSLSIILLLQ